MLSSPISEDINGQPIILFTSSIFYHMLEQLEEMMNANLIRLKFQQEDICILHNKYDYNL